MVIFDVPQKSPFELVSNIFFSALLICTVKYLLSAHVRGPLECCKEGSGR